jgi:hypothetical protein
MAQAAALVVLPSGQHGGEESNAGQAAASLAAQSLGDLCLTERVERALRATGYPALRAVAVSVCGRFVILEGRVPSYYLKQGAQAATLADPGIQELRNALEVLRPP